jgi:hypothetical protein
MTIDGEFLIFAIILGFGLMIYGHMSKIRIFNLLSVGVMIFLATQLSEFVPLLVVFIGLMIYELYYTFMGGE